jgi:hypothetical protein
MVAVFLTGEGFPDVTAASITAEQDAKEATAEIPLQLPLSGMAAVAVFQDLDGNGVLTRNVVGLPTEPYGFSKNARRNLRTANLRSRSRRSCDDDRTAADFRAVKPLLRSAPKQRDCKTALSSSQARDAKWQ